MLVQPYFNFDGRAEEAFTFYEKTLGARKEMMIRNSEAPPSAEGGCGDGGGMPPLPPGSENKILHISFRIGESLVMGSDGPCAGKPKFEGISMALTVAHEGVAKDKFAALSSGGGQVQMPLIPTFFSPAFGMVQDKFGVSWMIVAEA